jgi:hypothetical protein
MEFAPFLPLFIHHMFSGRFIIIGKELISILRAVLDFVLLELHVYSVPS